MCFYKYASPTLVNTPERSPPKIVIKTLFYRFDLAKCSAIVYYNVHASLTFVFKTLHLTLWSGHNVQHFADDIFHIKIGILLQISLKFLSYMCILQSPLIQVMAWCRTDDKPLTESVMTRIKNAIFPVSVTYIGNPIVKIRRSHDRLIFIMKIPYLERRSFYRNGTP